VTGSGVEGAGARNGLRRLVTTELRNPTTPATGAAIGAGGATGAIALATAEVVSALLVAVASSVFAAFATLAVVTVAGGWLAPIEVAGVDDAVLSEAVGASTFAALAVAECFEFDSGLAGLVVGSGADVAGGVLG
jgi:hypothetical protein